jgi:hypothetical protein
MVDIGDFVRVLGQDITGQVVEDYGNKVVILDECSEYDYPDNRLEYFKSEVEVI